MLMGVSCLLRGSVYVQLQSMFRRRCKKKVFSCRAHGDSNQSWYVCSSSFFSNSHSLVSHVIHHRQLYTYIYVYYGARPFIGDERLTAPCQVELSKGVEKCRGYDRDMMSKKLINQFFFLSVLGGEGDGGC